MNRFRAAVVTLALLVIAVLGNQATASATPTEQYPIDPAAQAASQV